MRQSKRTPKAPTRVVPRTSAPYMPKFVGAPTGTPKGTASVPKPALRGTALAKTVASPNIPDRPLPKKAMRIDDYMPTRRPPVTGKMASAKGLGKRKR